MNEIIKIKQINIKNNKFTQKCPLCYSILKAKWFGFKENCSHPECDNYEKGEIKNE